ncbi:glucosaminidase domain-containing protein [Candidatus Saccharibacteria bacterium]|nr:glucosaminidase domain-containing protein [Candidatus Saccharibacteria bacterium]
MKNAKKIILFLLGGMLIFGNGSVQALSESDYYKYSENNVYFYDPTSCRVGVSNSSQYDNLVIGADTSQTERMVNVVKQYGELAMDLQREWGTPWEVVFAQMEMESNTGTNLNSIAGRVAANGYFNWLGITGSGGSYSEGIPPYQGTDREWAQFPTVENMIKAWAGSYIARNGYYNKAFSNLDPASYDLRGFLNDFIMVYAPPKENDTSRYITSVISFIEGPIKTAREEMGWPSSEELAVRENIPVGGRHPLGSDTSSGSSSSSGGCTILRSAPDYNSSDYQARLTNLHHFSQMGSQESVFAYMPMCEDNPISTIYHGGCGEMSLFAAYYMFSGQGLGSSGNGDKELMKKILDAAEDDGYNICNMTDKNQYGENLESVTQMTATIGISVDWDSLMAELKEGKKIIISSATKYLFTRGSGHVMMMDHYNAEKDMIYLFDPAMSNQIEVSGEPQARTTALNEIIAEKGNGYIDYFNNNLFDGYYMSRQAIEELMHPTSAISVAYNGCYNAGANICRSTSDGLKSGGMTYEEAVSFMMAYREEASKKKFGSYGLGYDNGTIIGNGYVGESTCHDGTLNNCVAFSRWFVNNYTTAGPKANAAGDGYLYAKKLISDDGFLDNGQVPVVYSIFSVGDGSDNGHTGVVFGIDTVNDEIIIGEAGCTAGFTDSWPGVHKYALSKFTDGSYTFAYPGDQLKLGGL